LHTEGEEGDALLQHHAVCRLFYYLFFVSLLLASLSFLLDSLSASFLNDDRWKKMKKKEKEREREREKGERETGERRQSHLTEESPLFSFT
jgi:hypothetical protein